MVALVIDVAVALVCGSLLLGFRWWLAFKRESLAHQPIVELQTRLGEVEARVRAYGVAKAMGRVA